MKVVLLKSTKLGEVQSEDEAFGKTMMAKFLHALENKNNHADCIICYTEGIKNAVKGSETALSLEALQSAGTKILLCQSCMDYYKLAPENMVGTLSNMAEIADTLLHCDQVIVP